MLRRTLFCLVIACFTLMTSAWADVRLETSLKVGNLDKINQQSMVLEPGEWTRVQKGDLMLKVRVRPRLRNTYLAEVLVFRRNPAGNFALVGRPSLIAQWGKAALLQTAQPDDPGSKLELRVKASQI